MVFNGGTQTWRLRKFLRNIFDEYLKFGKTNRPKTQGSVLFINLLQYQNFSTSLNGWNIARIRKFISLKTTETLVHAFVNSKLDYCNSLAYALPKYLLQKLQYVQNAAARLITGIRKHDHITPILMDLHWLPVNERIQFKILLLTFKSLNGLAPVYVDEMIQRYVPNRKLRSSSAFLLKQNKWNLKSYGFRTFTVAAPFLWNSLPLEVKSSPSLNIFKSKLKTHLFKSAFNLN